MAARRCGYLRRRTLMPRRVSLFVGSVEAADRQATVQGEVWLGPILVGDCLTAASDGENEDEVRLLLTRITEPPAAQEVGRTARVIAVLTGEGVEFLRPGVVLLGDVDHT